MSGTETHLPQDDISEPSPTTKSCTEVGFKQSVIKIKITTFLIHVFHFLSLTLGIAEIHLNMFLFPHSSKI